MKICIIANGYPSRKDPQRGCFELDQALALKEQGHNVDILYLDGAFRLFWREIGVKHLKHNGINVFGLFIFPLKPFKILLPRITFIKLRQALLLYLFNRTYKQRKLPDVLYAHYLYNIAYVTKIKEQYNIPLVGIEHWSEINQLKLTKYVKYLGNIAYQRADKVVAVSKSLSKSIKKYFGIESIIVNNMFGREFLINNDTYIKKDDTSFNFLAIGSLIPRKGFDLLINSFYKTNLANRCKLTIIGGGAEYDRLQNQINSLSLQESVKLVGRKNKQEIISYLQKSHCFILSSHVETFSVVCIEAMALGVPVIATACGGPEEFITDEVGILIKPSDVEALTNAMIQMYDNYILYDNNKIAEYCRNKFAPEVITKQLSSIFEEVIANHNEKQ